MDVVIVSLDKSSPTILDPPETRSTIGVLLSAETDDRSTPLVSINESAKFKSGLIVSLGFSNFSVGPRKYP
jgi:hypothetical protein